MFRSKYFAMVSWLFTIIFIGLKISGSEYPSIQIIVNNQETIAKYLLLNIVYSSNFKIYLSLNIFILQSLTLP